MRRSIGCGGKAAIPSGRTSRAICRARLLFSSRRLGHVLIGNPLWVAYRHMNADLQRRFKELANGEGVYVGGKFASQTTWLRCSPFGLRIFIFVPLVALPSFCRWRR